MAPVSVKKQFLGSLIKSSVEMQEWINRPLDRVYPVIFIDAIHSKVREGTVTNRPFSIVLGVTTAGEKDILGIWAGDASGGEGANILARCPHGSKKPRHRESVCIAMIRVCDGLKGLPDAINTVWPQTIVQTGGPSHVWGSIIHLIRNSCTYASGKYW